MGTEERDIVAQNLEGSVEDRIVATTEGLVRGRASGGVERFLGIPFAQSPDGPLRFAEPRRVQPWPGVRDALAYGPAAPQSPDVPRDAMFDLPPHEWSETDCLTLNVWTPGGRPVAAAAPSRPVMVWIHGGAFLLGSGSDPSHDGARLARTRDVIVVTINYRLGALGFLAAAGVPTNLGLRDQVLALEWVRDNIGAFGGDPDNVTIFGQSAGAMSAVCLLAAPAATGLFHRVIVQSGSGEFAAERDAALAIGAEFSELLAAELGTGTELFDAPVGELLRVQADFERMMEERGIITPFIPVVDGEWLPEQPLRAIAAGRAAQVPVLLGHTRNEGRMFTELVPMPPMPEPAVAAAFAQAFTDSEAARAEYRASERWTGGTDLFAALLGDELFVQPTERLAVALVGAGHPTWRYRFDWSSTARGGVLGSCHSLEIPFVFDLLDLPGLERFTGEDPPQHIADFMSAAWTAFARSGRAPWPEFEPSTRICQVIDEHLETISDPGKERRHLWERLGRGA
ncbi:MAG: carboxylesterase family protein [Actinobacteria bacterium]|nr:carboxylesterase family protein [Actinomycetota bacterium]